jgi:hypothetical protein
MPNAGMLEEFLAGACVDAAVFALRPDYRAMLPAVGGLVPGPDGQASDALLQAAETAAAKALRDRPVEQLPHVTAWRRRTRRSGPNRSAPATAWRRCCAGPRPGCPG